MIRSGSKGPWLAAALLAPFSLLPAQAATKTETLQIVNDYSDIADMALNAPIVVVATIKKAIRLKEQDSPGIPAGHTRYLVTAAIERLVASPAALPSSTSYLVDVPFDSRGKPPKIKGSRAFLFLKQGPIPGQVVLTTPHSQIAWTPEADQLIRGILTEASASARPFSITGIGNAFHVPGTIPGESETQIFLTTSDQRPVSLSVLRRPGETPQWSVSLDEMVDEASRPPNRDTLLWYRLACFLPASLPDSAVNDADPAERTAVAADYAFIMRQLGPCGRTITQRP